ncbi:MAG TPA: hypothetical protein VGE67_13705 [Haloferula sp.]
MPPSHGTSILIGEDLFSFPLSKVEHQLKSWGAKFQVREAACAWSDLLGFGRHFVKSGWKPDIATWQKIAERLQAAYSIHLRYPSLPGNFMLLLNDGVVRTIVDNKDHAFCWPLAAWIRDVVWAHVDVTSTERATGYPGPRTIVTGGEHANYGLPAATMDDFANLATKEYPGMTKAAQAAGNPTIASNPAALQMNTAFSKAYILDDYGSEVGINGCGLFVDASFFELVRAHAQADQQRFTFVEEMREEGLFRGVKDANSDAHRQWMMRFVLAPEPIKVDVASLATTVWRVEKFYPHDGTPTDSCIEVPWYPSPPKKDQNPA